MKNKEVKKIVIRVVKFILIIIGGLAFIIAGAFIQLWVSKPN